VGAVGGGLPVDVVELPVVGVAGVVVLAGSVVVVELPVPELLPQPAIATAVVATAAPPANLRNSRLSITEG
jgi:hypothetical protein